MSRQCFLHVSCCLPLKLHPPARSPLASGGAEKGSESDENDDKHNNDSNNVIIVIVIIVKHTSNNNNKIKPSCSDTNHTTKRPLLLPTIMKILLLLIIMIIIIMIIQIMIIIIVVIISCPGPSPCRGLGGKPSSTSSASPTDKLSFQTDINTLPGREGHAIIQWLKASQFTHSLSHCNHVIQYQIAWHEISSNLRPHMITAWRL